MWNFIIYDLPPHKHHEITFFRLNFKIIVSPVLFNATNNNTTKKPFFLFASHFYLYTKSYLLRRVFLWDVMPSHLYLTNGETGCLKFPFRTTPSNRRLGKQSSFQEILWSSSFPTFTLNKYFQSINSYHYLFGLIFSYPDHKDPFRRRMRTLKTVFIAVHLMWECNIQIINTYQTVKLILYM